ncbi:E3 SUMO-protein ligase ZBED1-like [Alosa pseudoharengus]|uniref:E3 SUMO-protein ligase ZBED1-like n=1 Tax=Alosa pseudoharengus TaxID=34774 RepID=UPI003F8C172B
MPWPGKLDKSIAICKLCRAAIKYSGSTTNLSTHISRHHAAEANIDNASAAPSSTNMPPLENRDITQFIHQPQFSSNSARARRISTFVARFIALDLRPYSVVENDGFCDLVNELEPRYKIPRRQHFSEKRIPKLYIKTKDDLKERLLRAERVAITTDAWTSCATDSYVTITVHYVTSDWELESHVLQTRVFNESHTGKNIGALLKEACVEWNIADKDPALVTDNARNMIVAGVEAEMSPHLMCFAHTLNLAAQKAFRVSNAARVLGKVKKVVGFFYRNTTGADLLKQKQQQMALPGHTLINDVPTRWNSSHDMLERFLEQQPAIFATLMSRELRKGEDVSTLNENDLCNAEDMVKVMAPVKVITTVMCEDEQPTISMMAPLRAKLKKHFQATTEDTGLIREMKKVFLDDFEKRYTQVEDLLCIASALDPRFKSLPFLSDHDTERIFMCISDEATALHNKKAEETDKESHPSPMQEDPAHGDADNSPVEVQEEPRDGPPPCKKKKSTALDQLFGETYEVRTIGRSSRERANEEIQRYRERNLLPLNGSPLEWWRAQVDLPLLSAITKRYLCIPATSVAAERVFSTAGDIISSQRSDT